MGFRVRIRARALKSQENQPGSTARCLPCSTLVRRSPCQGPTSLFTFVCELGSCELAYSPCCYSADGAHAFCSKAQCPNVASDLRLD